MVDVRKALLAAGEKLAGRVEREIHDSGSAAAPALIEILADQSLRDEDGPGDGWAPIHAADLLGKLGAPGSVDHLLAVLAESEWGEVLKDRAMFALHNIGAAALEPTLRALDAANDDERRDDLCSVLSGLPVRDERVLPALLSQLARDPESGAMNLGGYRDASALPALFEALDRHVVQLDELLRDGPLIELMEAVRDLGGRPRPADLAKWQEMKRLCAQIEEDHEDGRPEEDEDPAERARRIGRNETCWCGSRRKYKKCHLEADQAAARERR